VTSAGGSFTALAREGPRASPGTGPAAISMGGSGGGGSIWRMGGEADEVHVRIGQLSFVDGRSGPHQRFEGIADIPDIGVHGGDHAAVSRYRRPRALSCRSRFLPHGRVLFLDELGEFPAVVLDALRQPLEEGLVRVSRARGSTAFPARFILVGAMNPCPCGESDPGDLYVFRGRPRALRPAVVGADSRPLRHRHPDRPPIPDVDGDLAVRVSHWSGLAEFRW
jgi:hypothetical protein